MSPDPKLILVVGPTAAGKTGVAVELAGRYRGEIIHADSRQVYRYMDIGTAKPTPAERKTTVHHLLDVVDPDQPFSAGEFFRLASLAIKRLAGSGRAIIVEGGTGLYLRTLTEGLLENPPRDGNIIRELEKEAEQGGLEPLYAQLKKIDPEAAGKISSNDKFRIIRALEVWKQTGESISVRRRKYTSQPPYDCLVLGIRRERSLLYRRIERRVDLMMQAGWLDEVKGLLDKGYKTSDPGMQAVGYRQLAAYRGGSLSLERALELTKRDSRRFAKRQLTWFRKVRNISWFDPGERDFSDNIQRTVGNWLN